MSMVSPQSHKPPFVDAGRLPSTQNAYVAWLDIMGIEAVMSRSLPISANFILKFHALALRAQSASVTLFPVMDGLYVLAKDQDLLRDALRGLFVGLAEMFIAEKEQKHRFLVRGGLAYGPVIAGGDISSKASAEIHAAPDYARTLLMGIPIIQAHRVEGLAPPFGCYIDSSARAFAPASKLPFNELWWSWWAPSHTGLARLLRSEVGVYFDWAASRAQAIGYASDRIAAHRICTEQYLPV